MIDFKFVSFIFRTLRLSDIIPESKLVSKPNPDTIDLNKIVLNSSDTTNTHKLNKCDFFEEECSALQEIFPESSILEIKHCITIANGDIDRATQIILDRQDNGESLTGSLTSCPKNPDIDDNELKNRIISR